MNPDLKEFSLLVGSTLVASACLSWYGVAKGKFRARRPDWRQLILAALFEGFAIYEICVRWPLDWLGISGFAAMFIIPVMLCFFERNPASQPKPGQAGLPEKASLLQSASTSPVSQQTKQNKQPCIYVFRPNPKRKTEGAFYQDGELQEEGFIDAEEEVRAQGIHHKLAVKYHPMDQNDSDETLINSMKKYYEDECATYFIMTMSSMARRVRDSFIEWHNKCASENKPPPILIVTVASAPDLTVASTPTHPSIGIVRWYVRSQEESALIAIYLRWKRKVERVAVFRERDSYGEHGKDEFRDRFISSALGGQCLGDFAITANEVEAKVAGFLGNLQELAINTGVLVIGYGNTLSKTVAELIKQNYPGVIACASTLTGPEWQPLNKSADDRIMTVLPRMRHPHNKLSDKDRDVVYYFAKSTLYRVIKLTAEDSNPKTFVERWRKCANTSPLREEHLADGDTIIHLEVADHPEQWR